MGRPGFAVPRMGKFGADSSTKIPQRRKGNILPPFTGLRSSKRAIKQQGLLRSVLPKALRRKPPGGCHYGLSPVQTVA